MQINNLYLYSNKIDLFTSTSASWTVERYRRVYNRNLKIYRGTDNRIDLQVKNSDQKPLNLSGANLIFNLIVADGKDLALSKDCIVVDDSIGRFNVTLSEKELIDLEPGFYQYSIVQETRNIIDDNNYIVTKKTPLYQDSQYGALSTLEIVDDVLGSVSDSLTINKFSYINPFTVGEPNSKYFLSSIIDANPKLEIPQSLHTFQFFTTNYTGTVYIQGSLDESSDPKNWVDLSTLSFVDSNIKYSNVVGKFNYFRIKHIPNSSVLTGSFTISQTILLSYLVTINEPGLGYKIGDVITITGNKLGGESITNDLTITVTDIGPGGSITSVSWQGTSYNGVKTFVVDAELPTVGTVDKILYR